MSITYNPLTNYAAKDTLPANNPDKVVRGVEFTADFDAISSAFATAAPAANPVFTGNATFDTLSVTSTAVMNDMLVQGIITDGGAAGINFTGGGTPLIAGFNIDASPLGLTTPATVNTTALSLNGVAVTATAAELNIMDGVTATTAELNILDGVTATAVELNYVDGVTSNVQTQIDTKAPIASPTFTGTSTVPSLVLATGATVTAILDEDDLVSDSPTALATQQSIKAYVDSLSLSPGTVTREQFTGDGTTTVFTLSVDNGALGAELQIFIDGVYQEAAGYTVAGTALTFSEAPPVDSTIETVAFAVAPIGATTANLVSYTPAGAGAVVTTVETKLRETISVEDFGAQGLSTAVDTAATSAAIAQAVATGALFIYCDLPVLKLSSGMDFQGVGIKGSGTDLAAVAGISNIGRLENCVVRGLSTDTESNNAITQTTGMSPKALYKDSANKLSIIMKRKTGGFIKAEHVYNSFTSGSSDTGVASETWRLADTRHLSACYIYKHAADSETAGAWGSSANMFVSQSFPTGTVSAKAVKYRSATAVDAEISWDIEASSVGEVRQLAIYSTGGSSSTIELYVNGVLQRSFSATLTGTNYILPIKFECTLVGTNTIKLKKVGGLSLNVIGADFYNLDEAPSLTTTDTLSYGDFNKNYTNTVGAQEYAFFSVAEQKWMGQIHGGETASVALKLTVDGVVTPVPATDEHFIVCKAMQFYQQSRMQTGADYMDVKTTYTYSADSSVYFTCSMEGNATVDKAYTTMSTTDEEFDEVSFPVVKRLVANKNLLSRTNVVTQFNRFTNQRLTTALTLYPMGGDTGANMTANGPYVALVAGSYAKLYYGPVTDSPTTLTKLGHSIERIFE